MNVNQLYDMFDQINIDCSYTGESVVPLTPKEYDEEYYADQIANIYELDKSLAKEWAKDLGLYIKRIAIMDKLLESDDLHALAHNLIVEAGEENGFDASGYVPCFDIDIPK